MSEGIYLIHTREFVNSKEPIYKIGRSININTRILQYPKGSNVLCSIKCENSNLCEKELIKLFTKLFKIRKDYGNEYFEGDHDNMIFVIITYLYQNKLNTFIETKIPIDYKTFDQTMCKGNSLVDTKSSDTKSSDEDINDINIISKDIVGIDRTRTCPKCRKLFKYKSLLKIHMQNTYHCITSSENIEKYINNDTIQKKHRCTTCKTSFTRNSDLTRHHLKSKCGKTQEAHNIKSTLGINKLTIEQLNLLYPQHTLLLNNE